MADQSKVVVPGKVQKDSNRKFKIKKDKASEVDVDIEIEEDGDYQVDKFSVDGLPTEMYDGTSIRWFNNFGIKKNGQYINQKYKITIPGLVNLLGKSKLVCRSFMSVIMGAIPVKKSLKSVSFSKSRFSC